MTVNLLWGSIWKSELLVMDINQHDEKWYDVKPISLDKTTSNTTFHVVGYIIGFGLEQQSNKSYVTSCRTNDSKSSVISKLVFQSHHSTIV